MKIKTIILSLIFISFCCTFSVAQFNPYSDEAKMLTTGIGVSGWGIPIFVRYEQGIAENITIGGTVSYQSKSYGSTGYKWRVSYFGISARGSYHFNELLNLNDSWDLYAGPTIGYYFGKFRTDDFVDGTANGGFGIGLHAGARYFINEKIAVNLDAGGGSLFGGVTIGATFIF